MSGPWVAEWDDSGGPYVFRRDEHPTTFADIMTHKSEADAWDYVLDCLVERRRLIAGHIKECRANVRRLSRPTPTKGAASDV